MCFAPQRRALFRHLNFQKWSDHGVLCTFWLRNVLRATTACKFSSLIWPAGSAPAALASLQTSSSSSSSSSPSASALSTSLHHLPCCWIKNCIFDWKELIAGVTDLILQKQVHALSRLCSLGGIPVAGETSKLRPKTNSGIKPTRRTCLVGMGRLGLIMRYSYRSFSILWPLKHAEKRGRSVDLEKEWTNPWHTYPFRQVKYSLKFPRFGQNQI